MTVKEKLSRLIGMMSPTKLAERSGLRATTISNYMTGGSIPRCDKAVRLADALNVDVRWLLDDTQDWPPIWSEKPEPATAA